MSHPSFSVEEIFHQAKQLIDPKEREAFLQGSCGKDLELRSKVDALLAADADASSFLVTGPGLGGKLDDRVLGAQVGDTIDRYKLLQEIGEGGFGVVYLAEQRVPIRRKVALKVIKLGMDTKQVLARFDVERQALAMMDHPNIAKVLDGGATKSGRPFFVMELVEGVPITTYCDAANLTVQERLRLFAQVCSAIQHAHQKGIVHRDIKPSNVMVTLHDGVPVPKVIDFGIAKATCAELTEKTLFTEYGQMIGTPVYMSPEQAEMSGLDIDTRSDIYSLGILLYELLTSTTPFTMQEVRAAGFAELQRFICEREPMRPSTRLSTLEKLNAVATKRGTEPKKLGQIMRGDLDWIIMKTLEKDRTLRYATANGLADDLERFLVDEPVWASPPSALRRAQKFVRRNRKAVLASATGLALFLAGLIGTTWGLIHERAANEVANEQTALAEKGALELTAKNLELVEANNRITEQSKRTEMLSYAGLLQAAKATLDSDSWASQNAGDAQRLLDLCPEPARGWEWNYVALQIHGEGDIVGKHKGRVSTVAWSPDGSLLASGAQDETVEIRSDQGELLRVLDGFRAPLNLVQWSPEGERLLTASNRGALQIWNPRTGEELYKLVASGPDMYVATWSPDGSKVIAGSGERRMRVWNANSGECIRDAHWPGAETPRGIAWSPDGMRLAGLSKHGDLKVWDVIKGIDLGEPEDVFLPAELDDLAYVRSVAWNPDGTRLLVGGGNGELWIQNFANGEAKLARKEGSSINAVVWSPDGNKFAIGSEDSVISVWDTGFAERLVVLRGEMGEVRSLAWSPASSQILSGGEDGTVRIWEAEQYPEELDFYGEAQSDAWSPDGSLMTGIGYLEGGDVVDAHSGDPVCSHGFSSWVWSGDGNRLLGAGSDNIDILDSRSGELVKSIATDGAFLGLEGLSWSPDESQVAYMVRGEKLRVVDVKSGLHRLLEIGGARPFSIVSWSPDWTHIATTVIGDGSLQIWDSATEELLVNLEGHRDNVESISWSPDGMKLATGSADRDLRVWDVASGDCDQVMMGHLTSVPAIDWSPDGSRLVSGDRGGNYRIWDVLTGVALLYLGPGDQSIGDGDYWGSSAVSVSWSSDGTRILASTEYGSFILESRLESLTALRKGSEARHLSDIQLEKAEAFVREMRDSYVFLEPMLEAIRQDPWLSDEQRALALECAEAAGEPSASKLNGYAWDLVDPDRDEMNTDVVWGLQLARAAVAQEPARWEYQDTLGWALFENGFQTEAVEAMERAAEFAPEDDVSDCRETLVLALFRNGFPTKAVEALERAVELTPDDDIADFLHSLGGDLFENGFSSQAVEVLERAVDLASDEDVSYIQEDLDNWRKAIGKSLESGGSVETDGD